MEQKNAQSFSLKWRLVATVIVAVLWFAAGYYYQQAEGGITGSVAVGQLQDSITGYAAAKTASDSSFTPQFLGWMALLLVGFVWIPGLVRLVKSKAVAVAAMVLGATLFTGCGPAEVRPIVEIKSNETAFVVPLEGESKKGQGKFMSVEFLEEAKVATKRIELPIRKRSTGRWPGDFAWIETVKVITLDRTPITREWTKAGSSGTSSSDQAIAVESLDSIGFSVGVTCTGMITEDDAAKYLYFFAGKPLAEVMDTNVRGFIQSVQAREFGNRSLTNCKKDKGAIFKITALETADHFKPMGLTINNLGSSEGLAYDNENIQAAINKAYVAEMDIDVAGQERLAQETRNKTKVDMAKAELTAAQEFAKSKDSAIEIRKLEIQSKLADAAVINAKANEVLASKISQGTVQLPSVLPQGAASVFLNTGAPVAK